MKLFWPWKSAVYNRERVIMARVRYSKHNQHYYLYEVTSSRLEPTVIPNCEPLLQTNFFLILNVQCLEPPKNAFEKSICISIFSNPKINFLVKFIYSDKVKKLCEIPPIIWLAVHRANNLWRFRKILWPS